MAHRRRGVGVGKKKATKSGNDPSSAAQALAKDLNEGDLEFVKRSLSSLESELTKFATEHADSIKTDPAFRSKFLKMCALLNIDPISSKQTLLGSALGIGDYYYEVAVKAAEVCMATRTKNGGVCSVEEVKRLLRKKGSSMTKVSTDDILLSISKLGVLGGGEVLRLGQRGRRQNFVELSSARPLCTNSLYSSFFLHSSQGSGSLPWKKSRTWSACQRC